MGGELDWAALEAVLEYVQVKNHDNCIYSINIIRDFSNKLREAKQA